MNKRHLYWLASILSFLGSSLFLYKVIFLGFPVTPGISADIWEIETRIRFTAHDGPVKVSLHVPQNIHSYAVINENFVSKGYGLTTTQAGENRQAVWSIRKASGTQTLYYRAVIQKVEVKEKVSKKALSKVRLIELEGANLVAAQALLEDIKKHSADLDTMVSQLIQKLRKPGIDENVALLVGKKPSTAKIVETVVNTLALDKIPAKLVRGVILEERSQRTKFIPWLQVFGGERWKYYDPQTGEAGKPDNYLVIWSGNESFAQVTGGGKPDFIVSARRSEEAGVTAAVTRGNVINPKLLAFSLLNLPLQTQEVYRVLLLIPVGALLLVVMRNIVGVKIFGTFMPILIALAFRETQLLWGIILFTLVVAMGLGLRFYLEHLKLLLVPRLASILIIVVLLMAFISVISYKLDLERGLSVALFPMIILTMTIERMSIVWEERGPAEAIQQGVGSLAVATLAYIVMSINLIGHLVFIFPELLFILLSLTLLLGRYSGYRLLELRRFKALAEKNR